MNSCLYSVMIRGSFATTYRTACGHEVEMQVPEEVGICFAPKPNDYGRLYCEYCGREKALEPEDRKSRRK